MHVAPAIAISVDELLALRHHPQAHANYAVAANGQWMGACRSRRRGQSTEFDDLRIYSIGDDVRHVDWRASARQNQLHTRLYREEKEHRSTLICDLRPGMFTGSQSLRANKATRLCASLLWHACANRTRVSLIILTHRGVTSVATGSGHEAAIRGCVQLAHAHATMIDNISLPHQQQPLLSDTDKLPPATADPVLTRAWVQHHAIHGGTSHIGPTLDTVAHWLLGRWRDHAEAVWVSGLDGEGKHFCATMGELNRYCRNIIVQVDEPMTRTALPAGEYHYQSCSAPSTASRVARISRADRRALQSTLDKLQRQRLTQLDQLMIECLSDMHGTQSVMSGLRQRGYLA